jgi:hypothetical protein
MKTFKGGISVMVAVLLAASFLVTGCGSGDPKKLAKQSFELGLQYVEALSDPEKEAELEKKSMDLYKKVAKLSEKNQAIYEAELTRLTDEMLGGLFQ